MDGAFQYGIPVKTRDFHSVVVNATYISLPTGNYLFVYWQWRFKDFPDWGRQSKRCHLSGGGNLLLPPANEVWGKVIFSQASVILFTEGGVRDMHAPQQILWDVVNERAVRILLECILVFDISPQNCIRVKKIGPRKGRVSLVPPPPEIRHWYYTL